MAMFVLVVDTSLMNVSISAVVHDLDTTVSGVQSTIALEALVSAAFILIGGKVGDLIGRKRAYVLGLLGYATGAIAMTLAQNLITIIIFWAIIGGLGASLLLPAMQSLIHGNFEGAAQTKVYALVGAAAAIAAAVGPLLGGFITTYLSWRIAFLLEVVIIAIVLSGIRMVRDAPYTGAREVDRVGAVLSVIGMGGIVLGILIWQEGGEWVGATLVIGALAMTGLVRWLIRRKRDGKPTLLDPDLFHSKVFRIGVSQQMLQQIALGGTMIVLPIYLQMVFEYNAMQAGLSIAPLSLSMFAMALLAGRRVGRRRPSTVIRIGLRLVPGRSAYRRGVGTWPARLSAEQLHPRPNQRGAGKRGRRRQLGGGLIRVVVRTGVRRRHHARNTVAGVHAHGERQYGAAREGAAASRAGAGA
jgi:MFS family permease